LNAEEKGREIVGVKEKAGEKEKAISQGCLNGQLRMKKQQWVRT